MTRAEVVARWRSDLNALPQGHARRWADAALSLGAISMLLAMLATPPWASIGAGLGVAGAVLSRAPIHRLPWFWLGAVYGAWITASMLSAWSQGIPGARPNPGGTAWCWIATPIVALGLSDLNRRRWAWIVVVAFATSSVTVAALQFLIGLGEGPLKIDPSGRSYQISRGFSEHHLTFGLSCALLLVASSQMRAAYAASRVVSWTARVVAVIGLLVCGSRAAILGAGAGFWATLSVRGRRWALIGTGILLLGGALLAVRFATTDPGRLADAARGQDGRWPIWKTSLHLAEERPLLGWGGKDAFKMAYRDAYPHVVPGAPSEFPDGAPHAHNAALSLTAEYGLPALALHLAFWASALWWLWRRRTVAPDGWRLGIAVAATAAIGGLFEPYPTRVIQGTAIHAMLGLAMAMGLETRRATATNPP